MDVRDVSAVSEFEIKVFSKKKSRPIDIVQCRGIFVIPANEKAVGKVEVVLGHRSTVCRD
jgi:hypothetical protein